MKPDSPQLVLPIQYLRGVAALMVVWHHGIGQIQGVEGYFPLRFGTSGVDLFFVISGFIMVMTTAGKNVTPMNFIGRRFIRVVPLYWMLTLALVALLLAAPSLFRTTVLTPGSLAQSLLFIPHYYLNTRNIWPSLPPGWTINYEMFFYLLFGLSILAGRWALVVVSVAICTLVVLGFLFNFDNPIMTFYTADVMLEFVMGIVVFWVISRNFGRALPRWQLVSIFVAAFAILFIDNSLPRSISRGIPAMLIVWTACKLFSGRPIRLLKLLGDASYSIYLFHLASFFFAIFIVKKIGFDTDPTHHVGAIIFIEMIVAAISGIVIYHLIERPVLRWLRSIFQRHRNVTA